VPDVIVIQPSQAFQNSVRRVAAYARVSSDSEDQLHSYFAQIRYYTDLIGEMENTVSAGIYADEGISGTQKCKRTEFLRLIRDCQRGKVDRIITKSVSRFARNTIESLETARMLKDLGVSICFEEDHLDTATMSSEALLTLKSAAAQAGSQSISKNMKLGVRMRMKNGTFITNMVPYGYDYRNQKMEVDPEKAELVRRIYREYLEGYGIQTIALRLNCEGVPYGSKAKMWHTSQIRSILTNPKYVGDMIMQRTYSADTFPYTRKRNHGEQQWYYKHNTHEAIIDRESFTRVQELLRCKNERHKKPAAIGEKPLLWRRLICGECGHIYQQKVTGCKTYWVCYYHKLSRYYCDAKPISEAALQSAFCALYNKLKGNGDQILAPAVEQLRAMQERRKKENPHLGEIDRQIADLGEQNLLLSKLKTKGYMDEEDYFEQKMELDSSLAELRKQRLLLVKEADSDDTLDSLIALQSLLQDGPAHMTEWIPEIFKALVANITVYPDKLTFRLYGGLELSENIAKEFQDNGT